MMENSEHEISSVSDFEFDVCGIMNRIICEIQADFNKFPKFKEHQAEEEERFYDMKCGKEEIDN